MGRPPGKEFSVESFVCGVTAPRGVGVIGKKAAAASDVILSGRKSPMSSKAPGDGKSMHRLFSERLEFKEVRLVYNGNSDPIFELLLEPELKVSV